MLVSTQPSKIVSAPLASSPLSPSSESPFRVHQAPPKQLQVGGFVPFTTVDFPLVPAACVVFCQGCPWRCPYCQNRDLQPLADAPIWEDVFRKIEERRHFLDGVVFSGGEPLLQEALGDALQRVRSLGLKTALHTSGAFPKHLEEVLPYLDWIGLDVKTWFEDYDTVTKVPRSGEAARQSLAILLHHTVPFECRTTLDPACISKEQLKTLALELHRQGVTHYALQECYDDQRRPLPSECLTPDFLETIRPLFPDFIVRKGS